MKIKKIQKRSLKGNHRAMHERLGALILVAATLTGMVTVDHQTRGYQREVTSRTSYAFAANTGRENETSRMPVKYDDVLRFQTVGGN